MPQLIAWCRFLYGFLIKFFFCSWKSLQGSTSVQRPKCQRHPRLPFGGSLHCRNQQRQFAQRWSQEGRQSRKAHYLWSVSWSGRGVPASHQRYQLVLQRRGLLQTRRLQSGDARWHRAVLWRSLRPRQQPTGRQGRLRKERSDMSFVKSYSSMYSCGLL